MKNTKTNIQKVLGWTNGLAILSAVFSVLGLFSVIAILLAAQSTSSGLAMGIGEMLTMIFWFGFYTTMMIIFRTSGSKLKRNLTISTMPYIIWIVAQLGNVVWQVSARIIEGGFESVDGWLVAPIVYAVITVLLAYFPLRYLKK